MGTLKLLIIFSAKISVQETFLCVTCAACAPDYAAANAPLYHLGFERLCEEDSTQCVK